MNFGLTNYDVRVLGGILAQIEWKLRTWLEGPRLFLAENRQTADPKNGSALLAADFVQEIVTKWWGGLNSENAQIVPRSA